jgi:hypothetical protein
MFQTKFVEEIKTHILRSVTFSPENRAVYEIMLKNRDQTEDHRRQYNTAHALCMPES